MELGRGWQAVVTVMRAHGKPGHLINICSVQARFEVPGVYGITKRATLAIGDTLHEELGTADRIEQPGIVLRPRVSTKA